MLTGLPDFENHLKVVSIRYKDVEFQRGLEIGVSFGNNARGINGELKLFLFFLLIIKTWIFLWSFKS